jgi:hypothetical protein
MKSWRFLIVLAGMLAAYGLLAYVILPAAEMNAAPATVLSAPLLVRLEDAVWERVSRILENRSRLGVARSLAHQEPPSETSLPAQSLKS